MGSLFGFLVLVIIIVAICQVIRNLNGGGNYPPKTKDYIDALHNTGLKLPKNARCKLFLKDDSLEIVGNNISFNLDLDKIQHVYKESRRTRKKTKNYMIITYMSKDSIKNMSFDVTWAFTSNSFIKELNQSKTSVHRSMDL